MSSPLSAKLRLVKCPKCRRVLPEVSNVPVYQCGGCNAVLQVKKRVNGTNDTGIHVYETDVSLKHKIQYDSREKETHDKIIETGHRNSKVGDCSSSGRESFETEDGLAKFPLKQIDGKDQNGKGSEDLSSPDESEELSSVHKPLHDVAEKGKKSVSDQVFPSDDVTCQDIKNLSPETGTSSEFDEDAITAYIFGNFKKEKVIAVEDSVLSPRRVSRESTSTENFPPPQPREATEVAPVTQETLENYEFLENQNSSNQDLIVNDFSVEELEDSSPKVVTKAKSKQNFLSRFVFGNSKKEKPLNVSIGSSIIDSPRLSSEIKLDENHMSPNDDEQIERPQLQKHSRFDSVSSEETLENIVFTNADDQDTDQYLRQLKGKSKEVESSHVKADSFSREKNKKPYETKRFNHGPVRSWTQFKNDDGLSRAHFRPRNDCGTKNDFPPRPVDPEDEKMRLKRMVLELQDELHRSRTPKGYSSGGLSHVPPCYHVSSEMEMCHDLNGYPNRYCQREPFPNQCKCTRIHCSAPIFQPNNCTAHINGSHYKNPYPCSDFPMKNFDKYHEEKKDYRAKKHVLPVKSGAPFVVCDNCSLLLQLPADFLLFRKRYHQLRCSSCSHVLKFSLRNGYHLDRCEDIEPGDLVYDLRDANANKKGKNISSNCPHVDSLCISDDYGPSICKSCSSESNDVHKKTSSSGSVDHRNLKKNEYVFKESQNIYKDSVSKAEKSSPKLRGRDVSPLFRLMDYNSAREILK